MSTTLFDRGEKRGAEMENVVQSDFGKPKPSPSRMVLCRVQLPPDGADSAEDPKQELEECANKWIANNTEEECTDSGYKVSARVIN